MKILFAPLITRLKINESQERIKMLARESMKRGHQVALSVNGCCNYSKIKGTTVYEAPMPKNWKSSRIKQKSGKESLPKDWLYLVENMHSFSDALYVMGAIGKKYYKKDVEAIINAIDKFNPDIVYSDLRPAAVSASLIRNIKIASTVTYPLCEYHSQDPYALDIINSYNSKMDIPKASSLCAFYEKSDLEFVPSIYELQPLAGKSIVFAGPIMEFKSIDKIVPAKKIIIKVRSMDQDFLLKKTVETFKNSDLKVLLISSKLQDKDFGNISVRKSVNINKQLAEAAVYIHNGENKDLLNSLMSKTPQIIVKANVYFLKYNGYSLQRNNAGIFIDESDFNKNKLPKLLDKIMKKDKYVDNTKKLSKILMKHGGAVKVIDEIEKLMGI